jgi:signal transduction histidine kinase
MRSFSKPAMSDRAKPLIGRAALAPPAGLAALLLMIWALTGAGYFWPMWAWFGLAVPLSLIAAVRWVRALPDARHRGLGTQAVACFGVLVVGNLAIWLMSGGGYFWPVWPLMTLAVLLGLWRIAPRPREHELEVRVEELTRTRAGAVDVQASELRRIERDLHDGAQARLVALSMQIGRVEERLTGKGADAGDLELLRQARNEATAAISELRDLARGISPPVLADRGLKAAVESLAERSGANVKVHADLLEHRPPPPVENAAYFVVAESLTNTTKHTPGVSVRITIWYEHSELGIVVADDGPGGADPAGSGLSGLRKRVEALDGWFEVTSPVGEGTTVRATLPCE